MEAYSVDNLIFAYPGAEHAALCGVDLTVEQGDFFVLCGYSGSGKSTLLRQLKPSLAPHGSLSGDIRFFGEDLASLSEREAACRIGFVQQSPEDQLVTDKVWHELAFGLENLGVEPDVIRRRVAETASFFGMESWYYRNVSSLSGGQKQLLALASVMVMQPQVLILDEPTAQLDPIAASEFFSTLRKINRELGTTVILSEHRLEEALSCANRAAMMQNGRILCKGTPTELGDYLREQNSPLFEAMPAAMRIWASVPSSLPCPVTVNEGRAFLEAYASDHEMLPLEPERKPSAGEKRIDAKELFFRYDKDGEDVLKGLSVSVRAGEMLCILGGNGSGKTTTLKLLAGMKKPLRGKIEICGKTALLPQDPCVLFMKKTLGEDLREVIPEEDPDRLEKVVSLCRLDTLLDRHPYDLSGGERQRAALAKLLLTEPDVLLLDEPTKGLDARFKRELAGILALLKKSGKSIVMVSHDIEFCALYADRCALLFDGRFVACDTPRAFFSGNSFYTTAANRMARALVPDAVTAEDVIVSMGGHLPGDQNGMTEENEPFCYEPGGADTPIQENQSRKLSLKTKLICLCCLLLVPVTLGLFFVYGKTEQYYLPAFLVLIECMLPFFLAFEGRRPRARELVVIATLCALNVAGRAAFFMLPQCKPMLAVTVIAALAFGGESGFLVGSVSMLVSNMLFSQGPWTPWQMFAMGLCGYLAGAIMRRGETNRSRVLIAVFGFVLAFIPYGLIVNASNALLFGGQGMSFGSFLAYYVSGLPFDLIHAAATAVFLFFGAMPFLEKLERLKSKYGLLI